MADRLTDQGRAFGNISRAMYRDRMTIRRRTSTSGPHGGQVPGTAVVLARDVPCRTRPADASEKQLAGETTGEIAIVVKAPAWQGSDLIEIDATCEIEIAPRGRVPAQTLKAVAPLPNQSLTFEVVGTKRA